jgi:hypothetical protein
LRSCCRWLPGPWAALPGLQLFAARLLQRLQLFAGQLLQRLQLFAAGRCLVRAAWTWCRWLPAQLVPGPRAWCRWLPADLVAQLLPVAAWSRSCCLVVFVFVLLVGPCL